MGTVKTLLTFEEFEQLPDKPGKQELVRGELIELPPAEYKHHKISHRIFRLLMAAIEKANARGEATELGEVFIEMGYYLSPTAWVLPDVSVTHAGQPADKYLMGAPAIAIEVISPSNTVRRIQTKAQLYFECGALEVWRVYPKTREVVIETPGGIRKVSGELAITTPLLPGLNVTLGEVFDA